MTKSTEAVESILKIITVNAASLRSAWKKGFLDYVTSSSPDIICVQETKFHDKMKEKIEDFTLSGYRGYFYNCDKKNGYSGTAIYTKYEPVNVTRAITDIDNEGRVILMEFDKFYLINAYVPMVGMKVEQEKVKYKVTEFNPRICQLMNELKKNKGVIYCGDLNVAHEDIDIFDPKGHDKTAGFTPEERKSFSEMIEQGYVDVFRSLHPELQNFTYFSYRFNAKARGRGWRLDYFIMNKEYYEQNIVDDCIIENTNFSDHSPVVLILNKNKVINSEKEVGNSSIVVLNHLNN